MNKRQRKKEELKLRKDLRRTPRHYPYYVLSTCCGNLVARYAVWLPLGGIILIGHWRTEKQLDFLMIEGDVVPACPACGGRGRPVLAKDYKDYLDKAREIRRKLYWDKSDITVTTDDSPKEGLEKDIEDALLKLLKSDSKVPYTDQGFPLLKEAFENLTDEQLDKYGLKRPKEN